MFVMYDSLLIFIGKSCWILALLRAEFPKYFPKLPTAIKRILADKFDFFNNYDIIF